MKLRGTDPGQHQIIRFLLQRPLLKAILSPKPTVLLIDEIDRADAEFEAFLLEVLSDFQVSVLELVGRRTVEAEQMAARRGLYIKVEGSRYDSEIERDHIMAQVPAAATMLKSHRSIKVWISRGRRQRTVPALEGTSVRTARLALDQSNVPLQRVIEVDDFARDGAIIVQNPPAGETEDVGDGVSLVVSRGPSAYARIMRNKSLNVGVTINDPFFTPLIITTFDVPHCFFRTADRLQCKYLN